MWYNLGFDTYRSSSRPCPSETLSSAAASQISAESSARFHVLTISETFMSGSSGSPTIVGDNASSHPPEQSSSGMSSSSGSNETTPRKRRLCSVGGDKKRQESNLRATTQNQIIFGDNMHTKSGRSNHATMIREPMPSGGVDAEVNPDFFFEVSCVLRGIVVWLCCYCLTNCVPCRLSA